MHIAAHRGTRIHAPENSLRALISGYTSGGETLEFDLQLTKDGHVVLSHDGTVNRMIGDEGDSRAVIDLTLDELRSLDYSAGICTPGLRDHRGWPSEFLYHRNDDHRVGIITLDEALNALPRDIPKLIELKYDSSLTTGRGDEFVDATLAIFRAHNIIQDAVTYSMDPAVVRRLRELEPDLRVCAFNYKMDISEQLDLMRGLHADGLVVQVRDVFDEKMELTEFGLGLRDEYDSGKIRVGAVLYPFQGSGVPWTISEEEHARMQKESFLWSCASDSMIDVEGYLRNRRTCFSDSFAGSDVDTSRVSLGYAKSNKYAEVFQQDGIHVRLAPYEGSETGSSDQPLDKRVNRLEEQMLYALGNWPFYSGGGVGVLQGIDGDFVAEVDYLIRDPMTQAVTLEMAVVNVDPGEHQNPSSSRHEQDTFFDPHGAPPYVGVEHDENDGHRINWNLGHDYENNRYGLPVGDGQTSQAGRLRLERRGAYFSAYYRNQTEAPDWICVGAVRNDSLNERVFLRCVAKRWRQRKSGEEGFWPIVANEIIFMNLEIAAVS